MIPRIGIFKVQRRDNPIKINHMVIVDGDIYKSICTRKELKHGIILDPSSKITCQHCKNHGWDRSLGRFGREASKDKNGRLLDWESIARLQAKDSM